MRVNCSGATSVGRATLSGGATFGGGGAVICGGATSGVGAAECVGATLDIGATLDGGAACNVGAASGGRGGAAIAAPCRSRSSRSFLASAAANGSRCNSLLLMLPHQPLS